MWCRAGREGRAPGAHARRRSGKYEQRADQNSWQTDRPAVRRYLRFLESAGYSLADVEVLACTVDEKAVAARAEAHAKAGVTAEQYGVDQSDDKVDDVDQRFDPDLPGEHRIKRR